MSVIAWDGKIIASDRMCTWGDTLSTTRKIFKLANGNIVGFTGTLGAGLAMKHWYENGADIDKFPDVQKSDDWTTFVVADHGWLMFYEKQPFPIEVIDKFYAFGSGREVALGVMAMGGSAIQAVKIASKYCSGCGKGIYWYDVSNKPRAKRKARKGE